MRLSRNGKRIGRPPKPVPQDIASRVVEGLAKGIPLEVICREPGMPTSRTVDRWRLADPLFASEVARARDVGFDVIASECLAIADDGRNDWMERHGKDDAGWQVNGEHIQRSKLRIETRLKLLACWDPRRYGDKLQVATDHSVRITLDTGVAPSALEHAQRITVEPAQLPAPAEDSAPE